MFLLLNSIVNSEFKCKNIRKHNIYGLDMKVERKILREDHANLSLFFSFGGPWGGNSCQGDKK